MIRGRVVVDKRTKELVKRIKANQIAIIDHQDIDHVASQSLVEKQVKAVLNLAPSISGNYPNNGPSILLEAGIPLIDININEDVSLQDGDYIWFENGNLFRKDRKIGRGVVLTKEIITARMAKARVNMENLLSDFIDNTLIYAQREKNLIVDLNTPDIGVSFKGKHVLIVVRGANYKEDLKAIRSYIQELKPVIIAVDGGADACLENGYQPDIVIGDMDSVSDHALKKSRYIIVHAYPDGRAPGLKRIKDLGLDYILFPAPGTSEDIAMILAHDKGAELIVAVGTHSNMVDFLEKGRAGMGSTFLVRLKLGDKLVDAKGVSKLYQSKIHSYYWLQVLLAFLLPLGLIGFFSPSIKHIIQLLALRIKLFFKLPLIFPFLF